MDSSVAKLPGAAASVDNALALLHALARDDAARRRSACLTEPRQATCQRFRGVHLEHVDDGLIAAFLRDRASLPHTWSDAKTRGADGDQESK